MLGAHSNTTQMMQLGQDFEHMQRAGGLHMQEPCSTQIAMWAWQPSLRHITETCKFHTGGSPNPDCNVGR